MNNCELITVVVPVYNVEKYLERCINSIIHQTIKNIEIILVNDGSTDGSRKICEYYRENDERVILINQENQGLSAARNTGIDKATGKYICFVDSDDWVHEKYLETMYNDIKEQDAQISIIEKQIIFEDAIKQKYLPRDNSIKIYDKSGAIKKMLQGNWIAAWDKMYDISLFETIRFPVGRNNEDYAILIYLFEQCQKIVYRDIKLYYYFQRTGSITKSKLNEHSFDEIINGKEIFKYTEKKYPKFAKYAQYNWITSLLKLSCQAVSSMEYQNKFKEIYDELYRNRKTFKKNDCLLRKQRIFFLFISRGEKAYKIFLKNYNRYKGE